MYSALLGSSLCILLLVSCHTSPKDVSVPPDKFNVLLSNYYPNGEYGYVHKVELIEHSFVLNNMNYRVYFADNGGTFVVNTTLDSLQKTLLECQIHMCKQ